MIIDESKNFVIWGEGSDNNNEIPKIIWTFWNNYTKSPLVESCFSQIRRLLPDYKFYILNESNVDQFIKVPSIRDDISFVNFTDLVRLKILFEYGGFWIDASVLLTDNLDWVHILQQNFKVDFIGYLADAFMTDFNYPIIETWFFGVSPKSKLVRDWFSDFEKCYLSQSPHKYFDLEKKNIENFSQRIDENLSHYLIAYLSLMKVTRLSKDYRILLISSLNSAHFYNFNMELKPHQLAKIFLYKNNLHEYPKIIKFEKRGRQAIDEVLLRGQYSKKSLLFKISPDKYYLKNKFSRILTYPKFLFKNILKKM